MNQFIIALCGPAGVGKDSVADALGWPKASFAQFLKDDLKPLADRLGLDLRIRADKEKLRPILVQCARTLRKLDPEVAVKRPTIPLGTRAVFTDLRYWNEVEKVWGMGGVVYELVRDGIRPTIGGEITSFAEIRKNLSRLGVTIPVIQNTTPEKAAQAIRFDLGERSKLIAQSLNR